MGESSTCKRRDVRREVVAVPGAGEGGRAASTRVHRPQSRSLGRPRPPGIGGLRNAGLHDFWKMHGYHSNEWWLIIVNFFKLPMPQEPYLVLIIERHWLPKEMSALKNPFAIKCDS